VVRSNAHRKGERLIDSLNCRVVIFFVFIFFEVGLLNLGDRVRRRPQRRFDSPFYSPAEDALECRMTWSEEFYQHRPTVVYKTLVYQATSYSILRLTSSELPIRTHNETFPSRLRTL
jgi:hypothetical protein